MKRLAMAAALLCIAVTSANADAINNLTFGVLPDNLQVPQSISDPCIICGTTQAHNPVGFGYNNFDTTGNTSQLVLFSTNITGTVAPGVQGTPYTGTQLLAFAGPLIGNGFSVAIDVNSAEGGNPPTIMQLVSFQLFDLSKPAGSRLIYDYTPLASTPMPDIQQGNGKADYMLSGFNLLAAGVQLGDNLVFRVEFSGATDGPDSFYIIPNGSVAVPFPVAGAGIPGLFGGLLLAGLAWRRRVRFS